ncbi:50S ribosomal protein L20, partial [Dysosmobacter welbionis]
HSLSLRPGGQHPLGLGRGRRHAAASGHDALSGCGPADRSGHQSAVLPAHRRLRPGLPRQGRLSGQAHPEKRRPPGRGRRPGRGLDRHQSGRGGPAQALRRVPAALRCQPAVAPAPEE